MEPGQLAQELIQRSRGALRYMVAIAGPPGSGKSTLAQKLHEHFQAVGETSVVVPMDGYHFDDIVLNARGHRSRKGAPYTFDAAGFLNLIKRIRACEPSVAIPVFDRTMELSRAAADIVEADTRLIIVEGSYLLLDQDSWRELKPLFDMTVFLNVPIAEIERRLMGRIMAHGHDEAYARNWIASNDLPNAQTVLQGSSTAEITLNYSNRRSFGIK